MELISLASPALADGFFATVPLGKLTTAVFECKKGKAKGQNFHPGMRKIILSKLNFKR